MKLNEIEWLDVTLEPAEEMRAQHESLDNIVQLGKPFMLDAVQRAKIAGQKLDPDLSSLLDDNRFFYVQFPLNVRPGSRHDVRFVALDVTLTSTDGEILCWSMEPLRVEREVKVSTESKLTGGLKLEVVEVGAEDVEGAEYVVYQPIIEAFGIRQRNPGWELSALEGRRISGVQLLHMVIQVAKSGQGQARVSLRADIYRQGLLWTYRVRRADEQAEFFSLTFP
jgi:hypothetical protein